jgi:hypothetical protein
MAGQGIRSVARAIAALQANDRPGPDWFTASEWGKLSKKAESTTRRQLNGYVEAGTWEQRHCGHTTYYRMKP